MNTARDAILLGTREAVETHTAFRIRQQIEEHGGSIDVFGIIKTLDILLLFRPLDALLGACVRLSDAGVGIMVTTRRDLHMQRFTAAHELGHFVLEHEGSLDREIRFPGQTNDRDPQEVAADAFAAEFLMPRWLFIAHAKRQGWTTKNLTDPLNVYQLSLRMAVSYEATCFGLLAHKILDWPAIERLRSVAPKTIKQQLLAGVELEDSWADVWQIHEFDDGGALDAGPGDLFVARLKEHGGSGFLWDTQGIEDAGFTVVEDHSEDENPEAIGGPALRRVVFKAPPEGTHQLGLVERRPWDRTATPNRSVMVSISTFGAQAEGLPRSSRVVQEQPYVQ